MVCVRSRSDSANMSLDFAITNAQRESLDWSLELAKADHLVRVGGAAVSQVWPERLKRLSCRIFFGNIGGVRKELQPHEESGSINRPDFAWPE